VIPSREWGLWKGLAVRDGNLVTGRENPSGIEVVVVLVPWATLPAALEQAGALEGKVATDTTNQFGSGPMPAAGQTAAAFNAGRMPGGAR